MKEIEFNLLINTIQQLTHNWYIHLLFWVILFDILTGIAKAAKLKKWDSKTSTNGFIRHLVVFSGTLVIGAYANILGFEPFGTSVGVFFIFSYTGSLAENWEALGLPFPENLRPYMAQMRKDADKKVAETLKVNTLEINAENIKHGGEK